MLMVNSLVELWIQISYLIKNLNSDIYTIQLISVGLNLNGYAFQIAILFVIDETFFPPKKMTWYCGFNFNTFKCDLLHFLFKHVVAKIDESRYKYMDHFDKCLPSASTFNFDRTMRKFFV